MSFVEGLNDRQKEAVLHTEGPLLILAGAGSGKTRVLTHRIAYMIEEKEVFPNNILAITFTNKAANEMKERVGSLVGDKIEDIWIGTFHSICVRILRMNINKIGYDRSFTIYDTADQKTLIKECIKEQNVDKEMFKEKTILGTISSLKDKMKGPDTYIKANEGNYYNETVGKIYALYEKKLRKNNALDFDDLILKTIQLLRTNPDVLELYQRKFRYIFVDEYQDTNKAQYELIKLFSGRYKNLCVVGDDDQCLVEGMTVNTPKGNIPIENLKEGDRVYSPSGWGEVMEGSINKVIRKEYEGPVVKIKTESGKTIRTTPNHIMFGKLNPQLGNYIVYLMYKKGLGYRVGQTQGVRSRKNQYVNGLMVRTNQEHGDKVWILKICKSKEEACFYEQLYSFKYGIPTTAFHGKGRRLSLTQESIDRLFNEIDTEKNVIKLMDDLLIFEEYPHHRPNAVIRGETLRRVVNLTFFGGRKTGKDSGWHSHRIHFNTTGDRLKEEYRNAGFPVRDGNRDTWRIETERKEYDEANEYIKDIEKLSDDLEVLRRARLTENEIFNYMPASHIKPTMSIAVFENDEIVEDIVKEVDIEEYKGCVYDISVPHFRQYISGGVVVHNSIYGWRGADIRNILDFEKDFPDAKIIKLEQNYRSTKNILTVANSIIKNNNERKNKKLWTDNIDGSPVILSKTFDERDEANFVAETIRELVDSGKYKPSDFAILYRTNAQSRAFEEVFMRRNISYKIVGGLKFYDRKEIKDIIAYLRLIQNPVDDISFRRVINVPKRGIGAATIEKIENYASQTGESLYSAILDVEDIPGLSKRAVNNLTKFTDMINKFIAMKEVMDLKDFIEEVVNDTGYIDELEKEDTIEATTRIENLKEFISVAIDFEMMNEEGTLEDFLADISLLSDVDNMEEANESVTMLTVHSAKGLEFPVVFLVGMEEGLFPMGRALDSESELEEERRLCYVAVTRAEEVLYITYANLRTIYGNTTYSSPSRFLKEMPRAIIQDGNEERLNTQGFKTSNLSFGGIGKKDKLRGMNENKQNVSIGSKVRHKKWGEGTVVQVKEKSGDMEIVVAFKEQGIKKLLLSVAPIEII